jgi:hypothetical protein
MQSLNHILVHRTNHSADCYTDHSLVCCKTRLEPKSFHCSKKEGRPRIDKSTTKWSQLSNDQLSLYCYLRRQQQPFRIRSVEQHEVYYPYYSTWHFWKKEGDSANWHFWKTEGDSAKRLVWSKLRAALTSCWSKANDPSRLQRQSLRRIT